MYSSCGEVNGLSTRYTDRGCASQTKLIETHVHELVHNNISTSNCSITCKAIKNPMMARVTTVREVICFRFIKKPLKRVGTGNGYPRYV